MLIEILLVWTVGIPLLAVALATTVAWSRQRRVRGGGSPEPVGRIEVIDLRAWSSQRSRGSCGTNEPQPAERVPSG